MCIIKTAVLYLDKKSDKITNRMVDAGGININKDISYNDSYPACKLDVFKREASSGKLPVIIFIHGGSFMASDKHYRRGYCTYLARLGYCVLNLNYPLSPKVKYKEMIKSLYSVFDFMEKHKEDFKLDTSKVAIMGDSAGAYLAMALTCLATSQKAREDYAVPEASIKPACGIFYCGVYKPRELIGKKVAFGVQKTIGKAFFGVTRLNDFDGKPIDFESNLLNYITPDFPPVMVTHTDFDDMCPAQGKLAVDAFNAMQIPLWEYHAVRIPVNHDWQLSFFSKPADAVRVATADLLKSALSGTVSNKYFEI